MAAVFGPYIAPGLRTEQAVVYTIAVPVLVLAAPVIRAPRAVNAVLVAWVLYAGVVVAGAFLPSTGLAGWQQGSVPAGVDNVLLPLAVMSLALGLIAWGADPVALLRRVALLCVLGMGLNTAAVLAQIRGTDWSAWWASDGVTSTAANAATNGRFSGLINQPSEAGLLYGMALLCAVYLWAERSALLLVAAAATLVGGTLTVSKVFLLAAVPLTAWQVVRLRRDRATRLAVLVSAVLAGVVAVQEGWVPVWTGAAQALSILPSANHSFLQAATASRFGSASTLAPVVDRVWAAAPALGLGPGGLAVPYDNGWVEAFVTGGVLGAGCYSAVFLALWAAWHPRARTPERRLLGSLSLLAAAASLGLPALTANRAATVVWLLLTLSLCAITLPERVLDTRTLLHTKRNRLLT